ncbi:uncharacterized protein LOC130216167 isoform X2 [Danio aesculapii]|uniref:uncharacterized protein LOC130216167 isoform X2 n=1 Tax=Danio aesculapii TaxID=1142201 RepID=UPI0024C0BE63|nr:uncharacterized protein LOC130216167 isoform X2 [Danio aesculapii]
MTNVFNLLSWILILLVLGVTGVYADAVLVSVMEEDSVTLHTDVKNQQPADIKWYFNNLRIAQRDADLSFICTDVQCNEGTERFRDRLKLDNQTGALTIMNIRYTHSGEYHPVVNGNGNGKGNGGRSFNVTVHDNPDAHRNQVKNPGEFVTFNPGVRSDQNVVMSFFYNNILIAEITGNQSQICTDVQCKERFTERLKLDNDTGSLTITNIRNTDSGNYTSEIFIRSDGRFSITREKRFGLTVICNFEINIAKLKAAFSLKEAALMMRGAQRKQ